MRCRGAGPCWSASSWQSGSVDVKADWYGAEAEGLSSLLVPGERPAGPDRLAREGRLLLMRVRPEGGIDLESLAPAGSQGDRLFALRSGLLGRTVLDGSWELALYEPEVPGTLPAAALALGIRSQHTAIAAAEALLTELAATWSVSRTPFRLPAGSGACLLELAVLPDLAPCYVATGSALAVGWNARALERALEAPARPGTDRAAARLELDLVRIAGTDAREAARIAETSGEAPPVVTWPWERLSAWAVHDEGALRIEALLAAPGAP